MPDHKPTVDQQWEAIEQHMLVAPLVAYDMLTQSLASLFSNDGFVERLRQKFEDGSEKHQGAWLEMEPEALWNEAIEEILDLWIYILMFTHRVEQTTQQPDETVTGE